MAFDGIDLESLRLIIELQIEDAEHLIEGTNNETAAFSDNELAAELYKSELQSLEVFTSDRALSARVADDEVSEDDDGHQLCVSRPASATGPYSEEDSEQHSDKPGVGDPRLQCYVCSDLVPVSEMVHCPCSHDYCFECLGQLYTSCLGDESLYPPRCCKQPIPIALARPALSDNFISEFEAKAVEFDTPNKTYCHRPTCSVFVPPDHIFQDVATCVKCLGLTCTICKGAKHESSDCPEDEVTQEVLNFAKENGWQRCEICHRLVELDHGCNHICKFDIVVAGTTFVNEAKTLRSLPLRPPVLLRLRTSMEDVRVPAVERGPPHGESGRHRQPGPSAASHAARRHRRPRGFRGA